jgi:diguanylate cyclase (GGDEF)-like protein
MIVAPFPPNETARLASLHKMQILATPAEEAFDRITRVAQHVFQMPTVLISIVDEQRQWFKSKVGMTAQETPRDISFCTHAVYNEEILVVEDASKDTRFCDNPLVCGPTQIRFYAGRPLRNQEGFVIGTLCLIDQKPRQFGGKEIAILDDLGYWAESVLLVRGLSKVTDTLLSELDTARRESLIDSLLRIWNRGAIIDILSREYDHAGRHGGRLGLFMVDVDHFKSINDKYGHPVGDEALIEVANVLRQQLRSYDSLGRYGGEEFMIVLPQTGPAAVTKLAERLRSAVEKTVIHVDGHALKCTISIGTAVIDGEGRRLEIDKVVMAVDQALLKAKAAGRNRTVHADLSVM